MSVEIIKPESVVADKAKERQLERRGIARDVLMRTLGGRYPPDLDDAHIRKGLLRNALALADELLAATTVD